MASFKFAEETDLPDNNGKACFTVFGVGGGGGNAVDHMVRSDISGVKFVCANTDRQALDKMSAPLRIQLGASSTRGLGAGANPEVGRQSAEEAEAEIREALQGSDMVFVTAGMGGGTGTGAAPIIASLAKEMGILTVGVVTTPFSYEGRKRAKAAEQGIENLAEHVDSLIIIPNEKLLTVYGDISMEDALRKADDVLLNAVRSIFDLIVNHGRINLDFADLKTAMSTRGYAMMGIGSARGDNRAQHAAEMAIRSPLLDNVVMRNAKGILINITASNEIKPSEVKIISQVVEEIADMDNGEVFYGTVFDPNARDEIRVTVIATGLTRDTSAPAHSAPRRPLHSQPAPASAQVGLLQASAPRATPTLVDDEDAPALARRQQVPVAASQPTAPQPAAEKTGAGRSIKDFINRQQR